MSSSDLFALLAHADPAERSSAAVALAAVDSEELPETLAQLAKYDALNPGVADAFYVALRSGYCPPEAYEQLRPWILAVLGSRRPGVKLSPIDGNNLEFHAHELFDEDPVALSMLLAWGYTHVVSMALDHSALRWPDWIALMKALYESGTTRDISLLKALAKASGVMHRDLCAVAPTIAFPGGQRGWILSSRARFWEARWMFAQGGPVKLDRRAAQSVFDGLVAAGLGLGPITASFDPEHVKHIAFPGLAGATRVTAMVRSDVQMTAAFDADGAVAIGVVRSKADGAR